MRRTRPADVRARSTSYTACVETSPERSRTTPRIDSVSACGWSWTAVSTATRGRVTRRPAPRSRASASLVPGTNPVWSTFWNESREQAGGPSLGRPLGGRSGGLRNTDPTRSEATWAGGGHEWDGWQRALPLSRRSLLKGAVALGLLTACTPTRTRTEPSASGSASALSGSSPTPAPATRATTLGVAIIGAGGMAAGLPPGWPGTRRWRDRPGPSRALLLVEAPASDRAQRSRQLARVPRPGPVVRTTLGTAPQPPAVPLRLALVLRRTAGGRGRQSGVERRSG